jgi:hypothetical protein
MWHRELTAEGEAFFLYRPPVSCRLIPQVLSVAEGFLGIDASYFCDVPGGEPALMAVDLAGVVFIGREGLPPSASLGELFRQQDFTLYDLQRCLLRGYLLPTDSRRVLLPRIDWPRWFALDWHHRLAGQIPPATVRF